ncbi:hypothetical protein FNF27_04219 [Cafeteria roenbergensis]|uniref:Uncharacterized protein n=1 Tax=Cafeteria roenbergensis TaxID=33653 RepID=A0A5A8CND5_CAFRO|nr:hypothetical protein FNF29_02650 [Cafeteria roenbergensis]KAA0174207.1 hypothetical protein FNF27_04219 [Cafeteria roenbergensis]|eukprot:KAA0154027.1 hypothetical protein FNF29_02650 [Cafeteria roenbergensis]
MTSASRERGGRSGRSSSWASSRWLAANARPTGESAGSIDQRRGPTALEKPELWVVEFNSAIHALAKVVIGLRTSTDNRRQLLTRRFFLHEWFAVETISLWWLEIERRARHEAMAQSSGADEWPE